MLAAREGITTQKLFGSLTFFVLLLQSVYKISSAAVTLLLKFLTFRSFPKKFLPMPKLLRGSYGQAAIEQSHVMHVVCPACDALYSNDQCINYQGAQTESVRCKNLSYLKVLIGG